MTSDTCPIKISEDKVLEGQWSMETGYQCLSSHSVPFYKVEAVLGWMTIGAIGNEHEGCRPKLNLGLQGSLYETVT